MEAERFQLIPQLSTEFLAQNTQEDSVKYDIILSLDSNANAYSKFLSDDGILITRTSQILLDTQKVKSS